MNQDRRARKPEQAGEGQAGKTRGGGNRRDAAPAGQARNRDLYRERILEAAQQLFREFGLEGVSMYMIAKTAGIGQGSLYRRYADIGEICSDLLKENTEQLLLGLEELASRLARGKAKVEAAGDAESAVASAAANPENGTSPAANSDAEPQAAAGEFKKMMDYLRLAIARIVDFIDVHAELLLRIKSEFTGKKQLTQFEHPFFERLNAVLTELIRQAVLTGEIRGVEPQFIGSALVAVLSPDLYLYQQKYHGATKEENLRGVLRLVEALALSGDSRTDA
ncbi:TetR/AcrR family transcriptional regulator [Paenibacillus macerans]|uniref:TetR/AcrR family transcriptional regulator n=1 Tax=Paenibacillus macerans TaxID=44252 RepID=UPI003D3197A8